MDATLSEELPRTEPTRGTADAAPRLRTDRHLWGTYIFLVMLASVELFSASIQEVQSNIFMPLIRHGAFIVVGLLAMLFLQHIHYRHIFSFIPVYVVGCLGLMVLVQLAGKEGSINEAQRAIQIGGVQVLPADALKLAVALGMAWILAKFKEKKKRKGHRRDVSNTGLVLCIIFLGTCAGLLFAHGLSNTIIVCAIGFSTMLVAGMSWKKFGIALLVFGVFGGAAYYFKTHAKADPAVQARIELTARLNMTEADSLAGNGRGTVWNGRLSKHFRPNKHLEAYNTADQQEQLSYIAQAHGGFIGVGIGRSRENARLPLAHSDYIFAIIVEELGAIVGILILAAYLWILGRSAKLTMRVRQPLPAVLAMACAFTIVFQALYHIAIVTGVFPVSGQPLPLFSRGGVSVLTTSLAFGVMLSVARHAVRTSDSLSEAKQEALLLPDSTLGVNPSIEQVDSK